MVRPFNEYADEPGAQSYLDSLSKTFAQVLRDRGVKIRDDGGASN
jgi:hypothetical protein